MYICVSCFISWSIFFLQDCRDFVADYNEAQTQNFWLRLSAVHGIVLGGSSQTFGWHHHLAGGTAFHVVTCIVFCDLISQTKPLFPQLSTCYPDLARVKLVGCWFFVPISESGCSILMTWSVPQKTRTASMHCSIQMLAVQFWQMVWSHDSCPGLRGWRWTLLAPQLWSCCRRGVRWWTKVTLRITKAKRLPGSTRFLQFKSSWMLVRFCTHLAETVVEDPPWPPCNMINVSCVAGLQRPSARSTSSTGIRSVRT